MGGRRTGVRKASASSIQVDFTYKGMRCREKIKIIPTKANLAWAERRRGEVLNAIERGTFVYSEFFPDSKKAKILSPIGYIRTVGQALDLYLQSAKTELQRSTWLDYKNSVRNKLQPAFGSIPLSQLTRAEIKAWVSTQNVSVKRIANVLLPLRATLADATADGLITLNPLYGWTPKKKAGREAKESVDPFTPEEIKDILDAAPDTLRNMFQLAFWTGVRTSELIALRWEDFDGTSLNIRRASVRQRIKPPKTSAGVRTVKLLAPALEAIKAQKPHTYLMQEWVFLNPDGGPWLDDQQLRKGAWAPTLERAGVRYRHPYMMRHTYASMMVSAGENMAWIAAQMGHRDTSMVARVYGHWIPEADPSAGEKAERLWK